MLIRVMAVIIIYLKAYINSRALTEISSHNSGSGRSRSAGATEGTVGGRGGGQAHDLFPGKSKESRRHERRSAAESEDEGRSDRHSEVSVQTNILHQVIQRDLMINHVRIQTINQRITM